MIARARATRFLGLETLAVVALVGLVSTAAEETPASAIAVALPDTGVFAPVAAQFQAWRARLAVLERVHALPAAERRMLDRFATPSSDAA